MARFDLLLELCSRQRAKTAASAARAVLGETSLQQAVGSLGSQSVRSGLAYTAEKPPFMDAH